MSNRNTEKLLKEHNDYVEKINSDLERLAKEVPESKILDRYRNEFQPITSKNPNYRQLQKQTKIARDFYESGITSPEAQRRSVAGAIDTLKKDYGIDYVNRRNFKSFFNFLDDARQRHLVGRYSSGYIIEKIKEAKDKGLTKAEIQANIQYWQEKYIKYDEDGKEIEPDKFVPIKVITGKRLENYREKVKERIKREAKGDY